MLEIIQDSLTEVTVVGNNADQDGVQVTDQDKAPTGKLLSALGNDTLSATDLMARLGLSHRPTFRKNYLNPALEQELIERTIKDATPEIYNSRNFSRLQNSYIGTFTNISCFSLLISRIFVQNHQFIL